MYLVCPDHRSRIVVTDAYATLSERPEAARSEGERSGGLYGYALKGSIVRQQSYSPSI